MVLSGDLFNESVYLTNTIFKDFLIFGSFVPTLIYFSPIHVILALMQHLGPTHNSKIFILFYDGILFLTIKS